MSFNILVELMEKWTLFSIIVFSLSYHIQEIYIIHQLHLKIIMGKFPCFCKHDSSFITKHVGCLLIVAMKLEVGLI